MLEIFALDRSGVLPEVVLSKCWPGHALTNRPYAQLQTVFENGPSTSVSPPGEDQVKMGGPDGRESGVAEMGGRGNEGSRVTPISFHSFSELSGSYADRLIPDSWGFMGIHGVSQGFTGDSRIHESLVNRS